MEFVAGRSKKSLDRVGAVTKCRRAPRQQVRCLRFRDVRPCPLCERVKSVDRDVSVDDRRGCFLIAAKTRHTSNRFVTRSELWKCPERRARLVVIVVAVADQSTSPPGDRCRGAGGAVLLANQSATVHGTFDLRRRRRHLIVVCLPVCDFATPGR